MSALVGPAAAYLAMLQRRAANMGFYKGPVDSDWGSGTQAAFEQIFSIAEQKVGAPALAAAPPPAPAPHPSTWPNLDPDYDWLRREPGVPAMLGQGLRELGTVEVAGGANSPKIMSWAKEVGLEHVYTADSVPWCGLFMSLCAHRAGFQPPANPLWALNWNNFGTRIGQPGLGDVLTFTRTTGGHVALYVGEDQATYHILGGNQSDKVSITRIAKIRLSEARRPPYGGPGAIDLAKATPANATPRRLSPVGAISTNEA